LQSLTAVELVDGANSNAPADTTTTASAAPAVPETEPGTTEPEFSSETMSPSASAQHGAYMSNDDPDASAPTHQSTVEEVRGVGDRYTKPFPKDKGAGATFGTDRTSFEQIRDDQILLGVEVLGPFESEEEWELAKWLIKNVGHNQTDTFLKLPIVSLLYYWQKSFNSPQF
jgi:hypothetical protein